MASATAADKPVQLIRTYRAFLDAIDLKPTELGALVESPFSFSGHEASRAQVRDLLAELAKVHQALSPANRETVLESVRADLRAKLLAAGEHERARRAAGTSAELRFPLEASVRSMRNFGQAHALAGNRHFLFDTDAVGTFDLPRSDWQTPPLSAQHNHHKHSWIVPGGEWVLVQRTRRSDMKPDTYDWIRAHSGITHERLPRLTGEHLSMLEHDTFLRFSLDGSRAAASKENYVLTQFPLGRRSGEAVSKRTIARTFLAIAPDGERVWSVGNWPNQDWSGDMFGQGEPGARGETHRLEGELPRVLQVSPTESPDRVVGLHQAPDGYRLFELDPNTREVTRSTPIGWAWWASFDERGRYFVRSVQKPSGFELYVYSMKTMNVVASGKWAGKLESASISPDGKKLLLSGADAVEPGTKHARPDSYWVGLYDLDAFIQGSARGITNAEGPR